MKVVKIERSELEDVETYQEIFEVESHHDHEITIDELGVIRWKKNEDVRELVDASDLNLIIRGLYESGHDKNSEVYRKLYRNMGYSLSGYWEVFYWEVNNPDAQKYNEERLLAKHK